MAPAEQDPLLLLRQAIASGSSIVPTTAAEPPSSGSAPPEASLSQATHMHFGLPAGAVSVAIDAPTRLIAGDSPVDLRSIYFAWLNREASVTQYIEDANRLNEELQNARSPTTAVRIYEFSKKVDLTTWLEGTNDRNELIKPLAEDEAAATAAAAAAGSASKGGGGAGGAGGGAGASAGAASARAGKGTLDPRLAVIYSGERRMGDHNTALRGIKPTDFSHVRKLAAPFMIKKSSSSSQHPSSGVGPGGQALPLNQKPQRRPDPIILLSPSASSLLRMSNIKSFLEGGRYTPPDHSSTASMLHISRTMRDIDPSRPMRFILVEGPEQFKPEHWNRVVAVFTTGQAWQFKNYRWPQPADLFRHVAGVYVGWRDQPPPDTVRAWGHRVQVHAIDKYREPVGAASASAAAAAAGLHNPMAADNSRFRDREVVESIWKGIEANMRSKGWQRDSGPTV